MISVFEKPDTAAQHALAIVCTMLQGCCFGALFDRFTKLRAPWWLLVGGFILTGLICWLRRWFV